jgi:hypothetical protein
LFKFRMLALMVTLPVSGNNRDELIIEL